MCQQDDAFLSELNSLLPMVFGTGHTAHSSVGFVPTDSLIIHARVGNELLFVDMFQFAAMCLDGCVGVRLMIGLSGDGTAETV